MVYKQKLDAFDITIYELIRNPFKSDNTLMVLIVKLPSVLYLTPYKKYTDSEMTPEVPVYNLPHTPTLPTFCCAADGSSSSSLSIQLTRLGPNELQDLRREEPSFLVR